MTSFKMFLVEGNIQTWEDNDIKSFASEVKKHCSEYLSLNKEIIIEQNGLWRGFSGKSMPKKNKFATVPRQDRSPMSMSRYFHEAIDDYFLKEFNFKYRASSVFCTQKQYYARSYGQTALIFPKNGYKLCTSNYVSDLYNFLDDPFTFSDNNEKNIADFLNKNKVDEADFRFGFSGYLSTIKHGTAKDFNTFYKFLDYLEYFETKKITDIKTTSEIMCKCDKYYGWINPYFLDIDKDRSFEYDQLLAELYDL